MIRIFFIVLIIFPSQFTFSQEIDLESEVLNFYRKAYDYQLSQSYDSALYFYDKAITISKDQKVLAQMLTNSSIIHGQLGNYESALDRAIKALKYFPDSTKERSSCLDNIGLIYYHTKEFNRSLEYHMQGLDLRENLGYDNGIAKSLNNIGKVYIELNQLDSAIKTLKRSLSIKIELNKPAETAKVYHNLGWAYLERGELQEAERYISKAYDIKKSGEQTESLGYTANLFGKLYCQKGQFEKVLPFIEEAKAIADKYGLLELKSHALLLESRLDKEWKLYDRQANVMEVYRQVQDSLLNQEKIRALVDLQMLYETEKKDQEIDYLHQVDQLQKDEISLHIKMTYTAFIFALFFLLLVFVILQLLMNNKRKNSHIQELNAEMQHRINNNLMLLSGVMKMQSSNVSDLDSIDLLKKTEARLNAMAIVHQKLYAKKNQRTINLQDYLTELCEYLQHSFTTINDLRIEVKVQDLKIDVDLVIYIGLIVNELVTNAIKHAFEEVQVPLIRVAIRAQSNGGIFLEVRDNGIGLNEESGHTSFGTKLIQTLTKQLKAEKVNFNENGAVFQFSIPLPHETRDISC